LYDKPKYDRFQFAGKRTKVVSADTHIAYSDYDRMHIERRVVQHERRLPTPAWAFDDKLLLEVVVTFVERRHHIRSGHLKPMQERLEAIREAAEGSLPGKMEMLNGRLDGYQGGVIVAREVQNADTQIVLDKRNLVAVLTAVCYRYYRCSLNSVEVAEELQLKPPHVRILLWRLNKVWNWIQAGRPAGWHWNNDFWAQKHTYWNRWRKSDDYTEFQIRRMRSAGKSWREVMAYFGMERLWDQAVARLASKSTAVRRHRVGAKIESGRRRREPGNLHRARRLLL